MKGAPAARCWIAAALVLGLVGASARADDGPKLVRIEIGRAMPLQRLLEAGLDVVEVHGASSEAGDARVLLWPGDEDTFEVFGRYYFPNDIQSPVTIGYDLDRGDFTVEDAAGPGQLRQTDDDMKPFRSPPERGDL